jgi:ABC-type glycerol-3-phosphate transport system substrate-binding protein
MKKIGLMTILAVLGACGAATAALLVKDGEAQAVVIHATDASEFERKAVQELTDSVEKMSGVRLPAVATDAAGLDTALRTAREAKQVPVVIGSLANVEQALGNKADIRGAFALLADATGVKIDGPVEGVYYGVIELLA